MQLRHARYLITAFTTPLRLSEPFDEIRDFDQRFRGIVRRHLAVLAWWSLLCIATGPLAILAFHGEAYYFFMMHMVWGFINLAFAILVFYHAIFRKFQKGDAFERFEAQRHVEKMLLLNIGLDFAYVFTGLLLHEHGLRESVALPELWQGFGWAIVVQGVFLFAQDTWVYRLHAANFVKAAPFLRVEMGVE
jgi:hypothetical protein